MSGTATPTSAVVHIVQRLHGSSASSVPPGVRRIQVCLTRAVIPRQTARKDACVCRHFKLKEFPPATASRAERAPASPVHSSAVPRSLVSRRRAPDPPGCRRQPALLRSTHPSRQALAGLAYLARRTPRRSQGCSSRMAGRERSCCLPFFHANAVKTRRTHCAPEAYGGGGFDRCARESQEPS